MRFLCAGMLIALASCGPKQQPQAPMRNSDEPMLPEPSAPPAVANTEARAQPPEPGSAGGLPDDRAPLVEPKGPIDPKSAEAAGQVVQSYGALIEQKKWSEAEKLWGDAGAASKLTTEFKRDTEAHLQIGKPGDMDGAAGSSYVTVPVVLYGKHANGAGFQRKGDVILRRVNDVPGSTEAQRRWHIERIEFGAAP